MTKDNRIFSDYLVKFLHHMIQESGAISSDAYTEANKNPETTIIDLNMQKGNIYSDIQLLFSMIYTIMSSINSISEKLASEKDIELIQNELMHRIDESLGPMKSAIEKWKRSEEKADKDEIYG